MATKRLFFKRLKLLKDSRCFWLFLFLLSACFSFGQDSNSPNDLAGNDLVGSDRGENSFRLVETPQGLQIIQRLSWFRDENDFRYEVIIEKQDENGFYIQILREDRTENFIEVSLAMGRYRYQVLVYNLLDRLEYSTNWAVFSIARARLPVLDRIRPSYLVLTGADELLTIELKGTNLLPESELSLHPAGAEGSPVLPVEYTAFPSENGGQVVFRSADLAAGRYELYIRNPGGFEAKRECVVRKRPPFDLFVSASYTPAFPVYGYLNDFFDGGIYPQGFSLRADFLPLRRPWGDLGMGAFVSWNYLSATQTGLDASARILNTHLNLLYQYTLSPRLVLTVRLGGGQTSVMDLSYDLNGIVQDPFSTWMFSLAGGVSLKWLFHPHGFAELGLDYANLFAVDGPQGLLLPFIGAGWKY
jgi:hypothetical protein